MMSTAEEKTLEQKIVLENLRKFLENELRPLLPEMDQNNFFPREIYRKLGEMGFLGAYYPQEYGGSKTDLITYFQIIEEIARFDAGFSMSVFASTVLFGRNVLLHGTEQQKKRYLPPLAKGETVGCWALTEPDAGSDALNISTRAKKNGDHFIINGSKTFITNAPIADNLIVQTLTGERKSLKGATAFILERGMPGLSTGKAFDKMGMRSSPTGEIFMADLKVHQDQVLGNENEAFLDMLQSLDAERSLGAAQILGLAQACLDASVRYAKERVQFGKPIANYQLIRAKLADMAAGVDIARTYAHHIIAMIEQGKRVTKEAAILKIFATEMTTRSALEAVQIYGGYGYMKEYPVERYVRDAKLYEIGGGTNEIQRLIISRELLKE